MEAAVSEAADPLGRRYATWFCLLVGGQVTDVLTSGAGMQRGTVEANAVAGAIIATGGLLLLWLVKMVIAGLIGAAALAARRHARLHPGHRADVLLRLIWRGTQLCVVALILISINNLVQALL
ncbi:MAG: hypothetical protein ACREPI_08160 [Candidatus Dormibacterales bacterium]